MEVTKSRQIGVRDRKVLVVNATVLAANWAVSAGKIAVGTLTGRLTILADGLHSLMDGLNNCFGIIALHMSAKPPDKDHPYGHRKFENVAAILIGGMIFLVAWEVLQNTAKSFWSHFAGKGEAMNPAEPTDLMYVGVLLGSILVNVLVARYERRQGKLLASPLLTADAGHTMSDTTLTGMSLISLFFGQRVWWADPVLSVGVLVFLCRTGWEIVQQNLPAFTDRAQLASYEVKKVAESVHGVLSTDAIRSHGTPADTHLDMNILIEHSLTAEDAERIEEEVREALRKKFPGLSLIAIQHNTLLEPKQKDK